MHCIEDFLEAAATAPPERDARHFRTWQRVAIQAQREVRLLAARTFFADESRAAADLDRAFTIVVFSSSKPCHGRRPMEFTYDLADSTILPTAFRLIGRSMQTRLAQISLGFQSNPRLRHRFAPAWHLDILNAVKRKPRELRELLASEAAMINALINLGTIRDERSARRFVKSTASAARTMGVDSAALQDLVLRTAVENLVERGILEDDDVFTAGSPDARVGGDENRNHGSPDGCRQMADAGVVSEVQACG
jgi:hypothetical protein